ncbi:transcription factor Adf-1-like [Anastrepha obliqua]|uniref:transcription factor Adf-1-like n=1 Tax=Anastrepha obliqua TaxID=95512 RepID=UPI00240A1984|nr:transcription factor Adf-1-like [Anastrepha obliqua]
MDELSEVLISKVQIHPYLYDDQHKEYKNLSAKEQAWKKIGEELKMSPMKVKSRWKNLRDSYVKYKNQLNKVTDAASLEAVHNRYLKWTGRTHLSFLDETLARRSQSSAQIPQKSENIVASIPSKRARNLSHSKTTRDNFKVYTNRLIKKSKSRIRSSFHSGSSRERERRAKNAYTREIQPSEDHSDSETNTVEFVPPENCLEISTTNGMVTKDSNVPLHMKQNKTFDTDITLHYLEDTRKYQTVHGRSDAIDYLFSSYAQTFRALNLRQQVNIKIEMAKLFASAELESLH